MCEMKLLPFHGLKYHEFCDELTPSYDDISHIARPVSSSDASPVDSTSPSILLLERCANEINRSNINCEDTFNHVYCEYLNQNDVPDLMCTGDPASISIFHSNVISLSKNLSKVEEVFSDCKNYPSVIAISETGLDDDIESEQIEIDGYHKLERDDSLTCKDGVGIYVTEQLGYTLRDDLKLGVDNCEDKWVEVHAIPDESQGRKNIDKSFVVGVIYCHPDRPFQHFTHKLCQTIEKLNRKKN